MKERLTFKRNDNGEMEAWQGDRTTGPLTFGECVDALHWFHNDMPIRFAFKTREQWAQAYVERITRRTGITGAL